VNFLVGENSTGKTSILALLSVLSSPDFWMTQDFNRFYHEFGGYDDIVSAHAIDRSYFHIGFYDKVKEKSSGKDSIHFFLMTYKQKDGLPCISRFTRLVKNKTATAILDEQYYHYKISALDSLGPLQDDVHNLFRSVAASHRSDKAGFKKIKARITHTQAIIPLIAILEALAEDKKLEVERLSFSIPFFTHDLAWLAPIRTKPKRTYDGYGKPFSPEGEHIPYLIRKQLKARSKAESFKQALETFGKESGLFKEVRIRKFGKEATSPFELHVVLTKEPLRINSVGYGVSQVLPVVVELLSRPRKKWFAVQQPEVHLHPKAQAALGSLIFHMALDESKSFLIETHSDFTIDRFRLHFGRRKEKDAEAQVLFFERTDTGNTLHSIPILPNGNYPEDQPHGFRGFFIKEEIDLLEL
jgi:hypothetical protein